ncbi:sialidase family protein [Candidatus Chloroploca sp. Khr17]|uniref:sialidase family protein n=1 Tax=Candidatus Chloroploca sp. Khr17 TaxID=2496869 RepID=UPI00101CEC18|nr:sialidase family protein [Candidatus Chloroploca sp. Khr17]
MLRRILLTLSSVFMLAAIVAVTAFPSMLQAQTPPPLRVLSEAIVPGSDQVKYPDIAAGNGLVHMSGNAERRSAFAWTKVPNAGNFAGRDELGPAGGDPDYSSTAITTALDGSVYAAWINQPERVIYARRRSPEGVWGPTSVVTRGEPFAVRPTIGVTGNGRVFVAWRNPDQPVSYSSSLNGGANWSSPLYASTLPSFGSGSQLSGGPGDNMAITFTAADGDRLHIFVGLWNGTSFTIERVTQPNNDGWADSSVTFAPNGKVYVAWRGIATGGPEAGYFFAERQPDGSWPRSRLVGGGVAGRAAITSDEQSNIHYNWLSGSLFYAFLPVGQPPIGPIQASSSGTFFNGTNAASIANSAFSHMVVEDFGGGGLSTRYALFEAAVNLFGGTPVIEDGEPLIGRSLDRAVKLTFTNVQGQPTHFRYAWNRVPTEADPLIPYEATVRITIPADILDSTRCEPVTLYTQLFDTVNGLVQEQVRSDTIQIDGLVGVEVNSFSVFSDEAQAALANEPELAGVSGSPITDPNYTRLPLVYLRVTPQNDCSGLTSFVVASSAEADGVEYQLAPEGFAGIVMLPDVLNLRPGPVPFNVRVKDGAGNLRGFDFSIIFDETRPRVNLPRLNSDPERYVITSTFAITAPMLQKVALSNIDELVTDDLYRAPGDPTRQFWALWMANSRTRVNDPLSTALPWVFVPAPASRPDGSLTNRVTEVGNWSLATGLASAQLQRGQYYIYVRFVDAAGNVSDDVLEIPVFIEGTGALPRLMNYIPLVNR